MKRLFRAARISCHVLAALPALALSACPDGSDVPVGYIDLLDLNECAGTTTRCKSGVASPAASTTPKVCSSEVVGRLEPIFELDLEARLCPQGGNEPFPRSCLQSDSYNGGMAVGSDGSLWTTAQSAAGVWLAHFTADGVELGSSNVANFPALNGGSVDYEADVAALPNGGAAVIIFASFIGPNADYPLDERVWVQRYASNAAPDGAPVVLSTLGVAGIRSTPDGKLLVAGDAPENGKHGVLAMLDGASLLWNQTKVPSIGTGKGWGVTGLSVDATSHTTVASTVSRNYDTDLQTWGISRYDASGNLVWTRSLATAAGGGTYGFFGGDAAGNVVLISELDLESGALATPASVTHRLQSLDASGASRFDYTFNFVRGLAVAADTGRSYVTENHLAGGRLYEISSDGSSCRAFTLPEGARQVALEQVLGDTLYSRTGRYRLVTNQ